MKLIVLGQHSCLDHDGDYETAVGLWHYTIESTCVVYALPNGARLFFEERVIQIDQSYSEPELDHFESAGKTHYPQHQDELNGASTASSHYLTGLVPMRHGEEAFYPKFGDLSYGWEPALSFKVTARDAEKWANGEMTDFPDRRAGTLCRVYEKRKNRNFQLWLDQLCFEALARIDARVSRAYTELGLDEKIAS